MPEWSLEGWKNSLPQIQEGVPYVNSALFYVKEMLQASHLAPSFNSNHLILQPGENQTMRDFVQKSGYSPTTNFGLFIQLIIAESRSTTDLQGYLSKLRPEAHTSLSSETKDKILAWQSTLSGIRILLKQVGTVIFGEKYNEYLTKTKRAIRGGTQSDKAREQVRTDLYNDVKTNFPLTSR